MSGMRSILIVALVFASAGVAALSQPTTARAATVDVVVDSTSVQLKEGDDGAQSAKVTLTNLRDAAVAVSASIPGDAGCDATPNPASIQPGRRTEVTVALTAGCDVKDGADIRFDFGSGVTPSSYVLKASPAPKATADWMILVWGFLIGVGVAIVVLAITFGRIVYHNKHVKKQSDRFGWGTELKYLGTDWTFKDNWVGNLTVGSAALVGLLAASNVLEAILGEKPEAAIGLLAVAAALAAVFVAIGPLVLKVAGDDLSVPTIGGTLVAAGVTLVATIGEIGAVTWQAAVLTTMPVQIGVIALGAFVGVVVWLYATQALWAYALTGTKPPRRKRSETLRAAKIVADAIGKLPGAQGFGESATADLTKEIEDLEADLSSSRRNGLL
jgi:hypothetical protein